ncbi:MAG TPA: hypothetical protein VGA80_06720 [Flavobacteriaceae bacterium]
MVRVEEKDKCFGIIEDGKEVVPFVHYSRESAIEEWVYFEKLNLTERQFLDHIRTIDEIDRIASELNGA